LRLAQGLRALPQTLFFFPYLNLIAVHIAYLDESGVVELNAGTSHFVLVALAIPASKWKAHDSRIQQIKNTHRLGDAEIHAAWMMRRYPEQQRIQGFEAMTDAQRRLSVTSERKADLAKASLRGQKAVKGLVRNYRHTEAFIQLTHAERVAALRAVADEVGTWQDCRLFGDVQRKSAHVGDAERIRDFAFEQVVTRFQTFLRVAGGPDAVGLLVHDQNETASRRLTGRMRSFHRTGTSFALIPIIETPLFVDSKLTAMVQLADLVGYSARRFTENQETDLFERIYGRFDRRGGRLVGLRHFTGQAPCACRICSDHGRS
jgi:hypothetical protein